MPSFRVTHQVFVLISVPLIFELIFVALLVLLNQRVSVEVESLNKSKEIIASIVALEKEMYLLLVEGTSFLSGNEKRDSSVLAKARTATSQCLVQVESTMKEEYDAETINTISHGVKSVVGNVDSLISTVESGGLFKIFVGGNNRKLLSLEDNFGVLIQEFDQILDHEKETAQTRSAAEKKTRETLTEAIYAGVVANVLLAAALAFGFGRLFVSKLERIVENAIRFGNRQEMLPSLTEDTELGYLDRTLHEMAKTVSLATKRERDVLENAADVICSLDEKGRFTSVSPAAATVWLYAPELLIGSRYSLFTDDGNDLLSRGESEFLMETSLRRADETNIDTIWSVKRSENQPGYFCVVRDVTEKKRAEDLLKASEAEIRTLIANMFTAVVKVDSDGIIMTANVRTAQLFEYDEESLVGKTLRNLLQSPAEYSDKIFFERMKEKNLDKVIEMTGIKSNGETVAIDLCLSEYLAFESKFYVVNILDSSERRKVQELKKQFVAMISHDLRTPIASVLGVIELAVAGVLGELPELCATRLSRAQVNLLKLMELINDLLEVEKLDSGTMQIALTSTAVNKLFYNAQISVDDLCQRNDIKLICTSLDISIMADEKRLSQVLINLISNSIKFSPKKSCIKLFAIEKPDSVEIVVSDEGTGIAAEELPFLFDRFSRVSKESETGIKSTGLGLSICKSIVELHDGTIHAQSTVGVGTTFHVNLPKLPVKVKNSDDG